MVCCVTCPLSSMHCTTIKTLYANFFFCLTDMYNPPRSRVIHQWTGRHLLWGRGCYLQDHQQTTGLEEGPLTQVCVMLYHRRKISLRNHVMSQRLVSDCFNYYASNNYELLNCQVWSRDHGLYEPWISPEMRNPSFSNVKGQSSVVYLLFAPQFPVQNRINLKILCTFFIENHLK